MADLAGNTLTNAKAIAISSTASTYKDQVGGTDSLDIYRINLKNRSSFNLNLKGLQTNADVQLVQDLNQNGRTDTGEVIASSRAPNTQTDSINIIGLSTGTYYVRVLPKAGSTNYQLTLSAANTSTTGFAYEVVKQTNAYRQQNGLPALAMNTQLSSAAKTHSQNMALQDFFSHTGEDGSSPWDRIGATGYNFSQAAENIAVGYSTPTAVVQGWINSPGHRTNILSANVTEIGVGYYYLSADTGSVNYNHYWSQVFAKPS